MGRRFLLVLYFSTYGIFRASKYRVTLYFSHILIYVEMYNYKILGYKMEIEDYLLEKIKLASNLAQHEDKLTWKKFSYFVSMNGILLSVLVGIISAQKYFSDNNINIWIIIFIISSYGAFVSFIWFITNIRGGAYHSYRLNQARILEEALDKGLDNRLDILSINSSYTLSIFEKNIDEQYLVDRPKRKKSVHSAVDLFCLILFFVWTLLSLSSIYHSGVLNNFFNMSYIFKYKGYMIIPFFVLGLTCLIKYLFGLERKKK